MRFEVVVTAEDGVEIDRLWVEPKEVSLFESIFCTERIHDRITEKTFAYARAVERLDAFLGLEE